MKDVQAKKQEALAKLQAAAALMDEIDKLLADATLILSEDGAYDEHESTDVGAVVREEIDTLKELVDIYVN